MFCISIFAVYFAATAQDIRIGLITSEYTPLTIKADLTSNLNGVLSEVQASLSLASPIKILWEDLRLNSAKGIWSIPSSFFDNDLKVIIDASSLAVFSQFLSYQALKLNFLHIVIGRPLNSIAGEVPTSNTLFTTSNYITQAKAIYDIIKTYSWQNIAFIYDQDPNNLQMAAYFKALIVSPMVLLDELILDIQDELSYTNLAHRLESTIRASGARIIIVMTNSVLANMLLRAADEKVMGGSGYAWIFNSQAFVHLEETAKNSHADVPPESFGILKTGALGILAEDEIYLSEDPLYPFLSAISLVANGFLKISDITGSSLYSYLLTNPSLSSMPYQLRFDATGVKTVNYYLYNIKSFAMTLVGKWDEANRNYLFYQYQSIVWPGMTNTAPNDRVPIIKICLLFPDTDSLGNLDPMGRAIKNGFDLALSEMNSKKLLGDYQIQTVYTDTLHSPELASISVKMHASLNILAYLGPDTSDLAIAYADALASYSDPKPLISYAASDYKLSDSTVYPRLLRTVQTDGLQAVAVAMLINVENWKSVGIIYSADNIGQGIFSSFQSNLKTLDINIKNSQDQMIKITYKSDGSLSDSTIAQVDLALQDIVRNQVKVIVYLGNEVLTAEIAKQAYEKELHGKEYCWVGSMWLTSKSLSYIDSYYSQYKDNIYKVLNGAFGLYFRTAQGELGKSFEANYKEKYNEAYSIYAMLAYDTAYLFGNTVSGMISRNEDFNSGKGLTDSLRAADFVGVSGKIKFSEGTNDRSAYGYSIINVQNRSLVIVQEYDPLNPNMFTNISNTSVIFGGESLIQPTSSWPIKYDCPFASHMSKVSTQGVAIVISIGAFLFIVTLILSYFSYKKWSQVEIIFISDPVIRTWKDTMAQVQIAVEFFQFVAIAPSFQSLKIVVEAASNIFMLDIMKVAQSSKADYWILLGAVCALCYSWFLLVILIMTNAENWLKKVPMCQRLLSIMNTLYLPFFGNTMFLPSLALLLDVFVCDHQAQGKNYVWRDCYMECWGDRHKPYIVMSIFAIALYEPVAVFSRPLWQQAKTGLNIKIKPFFLLLKTCVQILLIAVGKSLQGISPIAHGVVFSVLILGFTIITYKIQPFNYSRCNLWEFSSLVAVSYLSILATLSNSGDETNIGWFVALAVGWGLLVSGSFIVQKKYMPNLLIPSGDSKAKHKVYDVISAGKHNGDYSDDISKSQIYPENINAVIVPDIEVSRGENADEREKSSSSSDNDEAVPI